MSPYAPTVLALSSGTRIGSTIPSQITIAIIIFQSVRGNLKLHLHNGLKLSIEENSYLHTAN